MPSVFESLEAAQQTSNTYLQQLTSVNTATGTITAIGNSVAVPVVTKTTAIFQVSGTYTGNLSVQATLDGTNWTTLGGTGVLNLGTRAFTAGVPSATTGLFQMKVAGFTQVRITALTAVTGSASVGIVVVDAPSTFALDSPLPAGTSALGSVGQNGTWSVRIDSAGNSVRDLAATAAVITTITTTSASQSLLAANTARRSFIIENTGANGAIVSFSNTASAATRTLRIAAGAIYESNNAYTGAISVIQDSAGSTTLQVTSIIT
jgi:hypothetical protein